MLAHNIMKTGPTPSSEIARRVDSWFERNYENYPDGIQEYQTNEGGFEIKLDHDFNKKLFTDTIDEINQLEGEELDDGSVSVQEVEEVGDGLLHRHSIGVTFGPENIISLGGYDEPITASGEPSDTVVEETLQLLMLYLQSQSR